MSDALIQVGGVRDAQRQANDEHDPERLADVLHDQHGLKAGARLALKFAMHAADHRDEKRELLWREVAGVLAAKASSR